MPSFCPSSLVRDDYMQMRFLIVKFSLFSLLQPRPGYHSDDDRVGRVRRIVDCRDADLTGAERVPLGAARTPLRRSARIAAFRQL